MFSTGQLIFAGLFLVCFVFIIIKAYGKDRPLHKKNYKGIQYPTCIQCLPSKKRNLIFEQIEFGKELREMEKRLGID